MVDLNIIIFNFNTVPVTAVEKRWRDLKDNYVKWHKKQLEENKYNNEPTKKTHDYLYSEELSFLNEIIKHRTNFSKAQHSNSTAKVNSSASIDNSTSINTSASSVLTDVCNCSDMFKGLSEDEIKHVKDYVLRNRSTILKTCLMEPNLKNKKNIKEISQEFASNTFRQKQQRSPLYDNKNVPVFNLENGTSDLCSTNSLIPNTRFHYDISTDQVLPSCCSLMSEDIIPPSSTQEENFSNYSTR